jgi:hypothetical protein
MAQSYLPVSFALRSKNVANIT